MSKLKYVLILFISLLSCKNEPKAFSEEALNDTFLSLEGDSITFKDILDAHKGKSIVIDIWASWCGDCIKGMPKVKALQEQFPEVSYVFLSLKRIIIN